jgi:hypothetical protein
MIKPNNENYKQMSIIVILILSFASMVFSQTANWHYSSFQITDEHRYEYGAMGPHWGHHLGHMVRTADGQLWYVDDTGNDVYHNPAAFIHRFNGDGWDHFATAQNPNTIQQNVGSIAVGDTIYIYGLNTANGFIEEAKFDAISGEVIPYEHVLICGGGTNYIGAAVSPNGTRVVWWTRVVNNDGPSPWYYAYHDIDGWHGPITSWVPGNDFSYNFVSFENDTTFWITGELPGGAAPNWVFKMGAGKVRLGQPLEEMQVYTQDITAHSIWVNPNDGGVHLFGQSFGAQVSYYYHPPGGSWPADEISLPIGTVSRFRTIDSDDGNLYLVYNNNGFKMVALDKSTLTGPLDIADDEVIDIGQVIGFEATGSVWGETKCYQTTPVQGLAFAFYGNLWENSGLLRSLHVSPGAGPPLKLLLPNGQETLTGEETTTLSWRVNPEAGINEVGIEYRRSDSLWQTIEVRTANDGYAPWEVPGVNGTNFEIRIYDADNPSVADTCDRPFNITWEYVPSGPPIAEILSPTGPVTLDVNESLTATGTASDIDGYIVRHEWNMGDGSIYAGISMTTINHSWSTDGYYTITYRAKDNDGWWSVADSLLVTVGDPTSVVNAPNEQVGIPLNPKLLRSWPNPFNPTVNIEMHLVSSVMASIQIFDIGGHSVFTTQILGDSGSGTTNFVWNGSNNIGELIGSGCYLIHLSQAGKEDFMKVTLIR